MNWRIAMAITLKWRVTYQFFENIILAFNILGKTLQQFAYSRKTMPLIVRLNDISCRVIVLLLYRICCNALYGYFAFESSPEAWISSVWKIIREELACNGRDSFNGPAATILSEKITHDIHSVLDKDKSCHLVAMFFHKLSWRHCLV